MTARATELLAERVPFVHATVVRAQSPTSARAGDDAIILSDGTIEGFLGGQCAEESVRAAALEVLVRGESLLLRVLPDGEEGFPELPGAKVVVNPCLSGGAVEVFLEPQLPPPVLYIVGETPISDAVAALAESLGFAFAAVRTLEGNPPEGAVAVIVASHGREEPESIRVALEADVRFVGLVASRRRGEAVLGAMDLTKEERDRVHTPVGLDIGARTAGEVALSIMASVVRAMRVEGLVAPATPAPPPPLQRVDPVCGMAVVVGPDTPHRTVDGVEHWYCSTECRDRRARPVGH
jgi:xanthine dehydrogenase accessory factor